MTGIFKIKLRKGDTVIVRSGKYKSKTGKVLATHPTTNKVTSPYAGVCSTSVPTKKVTPSLFSV